MALPTVLEKIIARKFEEIDERKATLGLAELEASLVTIPPARGFVAALENKVSSGMPAIISEVKKASPSKGVIRENFVPAAIAKSYESAGAACLSVLTDKDFFQGSERYLREAQDACDLPILRKDFMVDAYQIYESRYIGADAILLIVAALTEEKLNELNDLAHSLGLDVLIEVHNEVELEVALKTKNKLVGINNRNLHNFETTLNTTLELLDRIDSGRLVITESGINERAQVEMMRNKGVQGFLIGEAFMRYDEPGEGLKELFF